ncbi:MAG: HEAT repeat domain-containing protein [Planctomycetes bacterium]|nr:HEAT repeat domain-containing protein [Planctomycetota bacterium]
MKAIPLVLFSWLGLGALAPAQDAAAQLQRAQLLERQEGDLRAAEAAYRQVLGDPAAAAAHQGAALRLGALLWRLDRRDEARPFLDRAVAAGGDGAAEAQALLQGQGDAASAEAARLERARQLLQRLEELVNAPGAGNHEGLLSEVRQNLLWLGAAGATALVERMTGWSMLEEGALRTRNGDILPMVTETVRLFWQIGTPPAQQFLERVAPSSSLGFRRVLTRNLHSNTAADLVPLCTLLLGDVDPTGEVGRNLDGVIQRFTLEALLDLGEQTTLPAQVALFRGLQGRWHRLESKERELVFARVGARLQQALGAAEPELARQAWYFAGLLGRQGPAAGRRLFLSALPAMPGMMYSENAGVVPLDDEDLRLLLLAVRSQKPHVLACARWFFGNQQPEWTQASVDAVLELIERGVVEQAVGEPKWGARLLATASGEQLVRLVPLLPRIGNPETALPAWFQSEPGAELPLAAAGPLRQLLDRCFANPPNSWHLFDTRQMVKNGPKVQAAAGMTYSLLYMLGRLPDPATVPWLLQQLQTRPGLVDALACASLLLSRSGCQEAANAMRVLLTWSGTPEVSMAASTRVCLFAELVRIGSREAIQEFSTAYSLGMGLADIWPPQASLRRLSGVVQGTATTQFSSATVRLGGINLLSDVSDRSGGVRVPLYGYGREDLIAAWRVLLDSPVAQQFVTEAGQVHDLRAPLAVLPLFAERLPTIWAGLGNDVGQRVLSFLFASFSDVTTENLAADPALAPAIAGLLRFEDAIATRVLASLPPKVVRETFPAEALHVLRAVPQIFGQGMWKRIGIPLNVADWQHLLRTADASLLGSLVSELPTPLDPALRPLLEATLRSSDLDVRRIGCGALARLSAFDSVGALLAMLNDPEPLVRKAATEALEQLRFQQEQRSYWNTAGTGIDASPAAALAKLLQQAKAGAAKDQRLLAIRSLAALGRPEALPFLIEAIQDQDPDVAAAARAAVALLHERAGSKPQ